MSSLSAIIAIVLSVLSVHQQSVSGGASTVCDGKPETSGCGCWKGWCFGYLDIPAKNGDTWCYTQRLGVSSPQKDWASCSFGDHTKCSSLMTCGDSKRYKGNDVLQPNDPTVCNGDTCGCYKGWCYKYPKVGEKPWCYTQKLGVEENKGDWAPCSWRDHTQCNIEMTCGEDRRFIGEDTVGGRVFGVLG